MHSNTFGNSDRYKMLVYLTELISKLDDNERNYISSYINDFNNLMVFYISLEKGKHKQYVNSLITMDWKRRTRLLPDKYPKKLKTYLLNYIIARLKND